MGYPRYTVEFGKAVLLFKMPSGVMKYREANYSGESAKVVNLGLAKEIDAIIKEGASQTKTAENVYLSTVSIKRIYVKN